jgi:predicted porin
MQKKLIALAVASAAAAFASAPVMAQSNVSVYGVIDQAITTQSQASGGSVSSLLGSGYTTERLGFKGSEDLGNGLKANFMLETGFNSANGYQDAQFWQRTSTVGLSGANWGSVNFGRQYTPVFSVQATNDLFRVAGVGSIYSLTNTGVTRSSNSIRYDSPDMSGFSLAAMYSMGDTGTGHVSTGGPLTAPLVGTFPKNLGRNAGFNVKYANGPLLLMAGYNKLYETALDVNNQWNSQKTTAVTGSYDFKVVAIQAGWQENKIDDNQADMTVWNVGGVVPVFGADSVKLQYSDRHDKLNSSDDSKLTAIGYVHPMSKRTTLYATYAKMKNDNNAKQGLIFGTPGLDITPGYSPDGFQLGLSHNF